MFDQVSIECPRCNQDTDNPVIMGTYHVCNNCNAILIPLFESDNIVADVIDSTDTFVSPTLSKQKINWDKVPLEFLSDKGWSNPAIMLEKLSKSNDTQKPTPSGIGGWLIFFAFSIFGSLISCFLLSSINRDLYDSFKFLELQNPVAKLFLDFEFFVYMLFAIYLVNLIFLMFLKNKAFPKRVIIFFLLNTLFSLIEMVWIININNDITDYRQKLPSGTNDFIFALVFAFLWIPYFAYSSRVNNTFVKSFFKKRKQKIIENIS